jgi:hypothetical protein
VDPIITGAVAKAADSHANESAKVTSNLLIRLLGPAMDEYGDQLREMVARQRASRAEKLLRKAAEKSESREGTVPPRVAYRVLEDGTLSDDEIMAEYLSGVLAGSRSPGGRDDRAVVWSDLVSRLSSLQLRAHYVLYREWAEGLRGRTDVYLAGASDRPKATIVLDLNEFVSVVNDPENPLPATEMLLHIIWGLERVGLIGDFQYGPSSKLEQEPRPAFPYFLEAQPTVSGIELWGWAAGVPGLEASRFVRNAPTINVAPPLRRLATTTFPKLPAPPTPTTLQVP